MVIGTPVSWVVMRAYAITSEVLDRVKFTASSLDEEIVVVFPKLIIGFNRCITVMT